MEVVEVIASSSVRLLVPLLLAVLGELISERAGIMNVGLEGMMTAGAFAAYAGVLFAWGLPAAIVFAALAGLCAALLMAFGSVWLKGNPILVGFALFILLPGIANFVYIQTGWTAGTPALHAITVPVLSKLPLLGLALFSENIFYYLAVGVTIAVWLMFRYTLVGLVISAVGHSPASAATRGISPRWVQTLALMACGALAGLGGAALSLGAVGSYVPNIIGGRGFIVIAIVILGRWSVGGAVAGTVALGMLNAVELSLAQQPHVPVQLLGALPWIVVILMLIVSARMRSNAPRSLVQ
jgi:general nucleoside transport system permease protein